MDLLRKDNSLLKIRYYYNQTECIKCSLPSTCPKDVSLYDTLDKCKLSSIQTTRHKQNEVLTSPKPTPTPTPKPTPSSSQSPTPSSNINLAFTCDVLTGTVNPCFKPTAPTPTTPSSCSNDSVCTKCPINNFGEVECNKIIGNPKECCGNDTSGTCISQCTPKCLKGEGGTYEKARDACPSFECKLSDEEFSRVCVTGEPKTDGKGQSMFSCNTVCPPSGPPPPYGGYMCQGDSSLPNYGCFSVGKNDPVSGISYDSCVDICNTNAKYVCKNGSCVIASAGESGSNFTTCMAGCEAVSDECTPRTAEGGCPCNANPEQLNWGWAWSGSNFCDGRPASAEKYLVTQTRDLTGYTEKAANEAGLSIKSLNNSINDQLS